MKMRLALLAVVLATLATGLRAEVAFTGLGHLPNEMSASPRGVTPDGKVVVGGAYVGDNPILVAFRWTKTGGMISIHDPKFLGTSAWGVSADGQTILVFTYFKLIASGLQEDGRAYFWRADKGTGEPITLPLDQNPENRDLNLVRLTPEGGLVAFGSERTYRWKDGVWSTDAGFGELVPPPGERFAVPKAISSDGKIIAGVIAMSNDQGKPLRWTQSTGWVPMDRFPEPEMLMNPGPQVISEDGNLIGGLGSAHGALIWDAKGHIYALKDYLTKVCGLDLKDWLLTDVGAIAGAGGVYAIAGTGYHSNHGEPLDTMANPQLNKIAQKEGFLVTGLTLPKTIADQPATNTPADTNTPRPTSAVPSNPAR